MQNVSLSLRQQQGLQSKENSSLIMKLLLLFTVAETQLQ